MSARAILVNGVNWVISDAVLILTSHLVPPNDFGHSDGSGNPTRRKLLSRRDLSHSGGQSSPISLQHKDGINGYRTHPLLRRHSEKR